MCPKLYIDGRCGTVMDFVVAMMLDLPQPVTSVQAKHCKLYQSFLYFQLNFPCFHAKLI